MKNKNLKRYIFFVLVVVTVILFFWSALYLDYSIDNAKPISFSSLFSFLSVFGVLFLIIVFLCVFIFAVYKLIDHAAVKTRLHLIGNDISAKVRLKNAKQIYPCLLSFFYSVLERNNEFLNLPLGKDCSALIPNGYRPIYRQKSMFYIFQLIMPDKPSFEESTLKQLIQSYIDGELLNFGIAGLSSCFNSRIFGNVSTVVVDRVHYKESQHMLNFALLYVCNEDDANYAVKAQQRDTDIQKAERTVYDDEIT